MNRIERVSAGLIAVIFFSSLVGTTWAVGWTEAYDQAFIDARKSGRFVLLDFSGSDWCGWCKKLDEEVFNQPEFEQFAKARLVCVLLDFPRSKEQADQIKRQNAELAKRFGITGYPSILLLDSSEKIVGRTGYREGGAKRYVEHLQKMIYSPDSSVVLSRHASSMNFRNGLVGEWRNVDPETRSYKRLKIYKNDDICQIRIWSSVSGGERENDLGLVRLETCGVTLGHTTWNYADAIQDHGFCTVMYRLTLDGKILLLDSLTCYKDNSKRKDSHLMEVFMRAEDIHKASEAIGVQGAPQPQR